jgi:hypothetical protein
MYLQRWVNVSISVYNFFIIFLVNNIKYIRASSLVVTNDELLIYCS